MHIAFLILFSLFFARGDDGVGIDPFGRRAVRGQSGCSLDPNGACRVGGLSDEGNGFDPHGGRVTGQGDGGPGMDPNG